ncbi:MAG TPA: GntR family transcriptional regulator [Rhabdaerophilum sp.]|nr:GntR family transcriptional regulator [Rhabdaerophilum sp.]
MNTLLRHRTLPAAIADALRKAILGGEHKAGDQLRQDRLAETFGTSRIPVREALIQLESEGFVTMVPHKGAVVTGLSRAEIDDVFDLRVLLEPRLLRHSLPRLTPEDFARLDALEGRFSAALAAGNAEEWGRLNAEFHLALYAKADLPRTLATVIGLLQTSERYTRLQLSDAARLERAMAEHRALVRLCRRGVADEAVKLLGDHVEAVRHDLLALAVP